MGRKKEIEHSAVFDKEKEVWVEIMERERRTFLFWAKQMGYRWIDGKEIDDAEKSAFLHYALYQDGRLGIVPAFAWISAQSKRVRRCSFSKFDWKLTFF